MSNRLQLRECDRCGFVFHKNVLKQKDGLWLDEECYDTPKPSKKSLGGEGEIGASQKRANSTTTTVPPESARVVQYITNSGGIALNLNVPWMLVTASSTYVSWILSN